MIAYSKIFFLEKREEGSRKKKKMTNTKAFIQESGPDSVMPEFRSRADERFATPKLVEDTASLIRAQRKKNSRIRKRAVTTADVTTADVTTTDVTAADATTAADRQPPQRDSSCCSTEPSASFAGRLASDTEPRVAEAETLSVQNSELVLPGTSYVSRYPCFCRCGSWCLSCLYKR